VLVRKQTYPMTVFCPSKDWVYHVLRTTPFDETLRAYVANVLYEMHKPSAKDLSKDSIVLTYANAIQSGDFFEFLKIGDWSLFYCSIFYSSMNYSVVEELGRLSYGTCFRLIGKSWPVYKTLADSLPEVIFEVIKAVKNDLFDLPDHERR